MVLPSQSSHKRFVVIDIYPKNALAAEPLYIGVASPPGCYYDYHGMMERMGMQMAADEIPL
jgi:hypothetical protein